MKILTFSTALVSEFFRQFSFRHLIPTSSRLIIREIILAFAWHITCSILFATNREDITFGQFDARLVRRLQQSEQRGTGTIPTFTPRSGMLLSSIIHSQQPPKQEPDCPAVSELFICSRQYCDGISPGHLDTGRQAYREFQ